MIINNNSILTPATRNNLNAFMHRIINSNGLFVVNGYMENPFFQAAQLSIYSPDTGLQFNIDISRDGEIRLPYYPQMGGRSIHAVIETPMYNINNIGPDELWNRFLDYNELIFENYGTEIMNLHNGQPSNILVTEQDLEAQLR